MCAGLQHTRADANERVKDSGVLRSKLLQHVAQTPSPRTTFELVHLISWVCRCYEVQVGAGTQKAERAE